MPGGLRCRDEPASIAGSVRPRSPWRLSRVSRAGRRGQPARRAGGGLPPGGRERRPRGGGLPAHRRMTHAWLAYADERTLLLPDILPGATRGPRAAHLPAAQLGRRTTTPTSSPPPGSPTGRSTRAACARCCGARSATNALDAIPADLDLEIGEARPAEPLRRGRVRQGRADRDHGAARPHALVLPDVRHDGRPHEARARRERLRPAARCRAPSSTATRSRPSSGSLR